MYFLFIKLKSVFETVWKRLRIYVKYDITEKGGIQASNGRSNRCFKVDKYSKRRN